MMGSAIQSRRYLRGFQLADFAQSEFASMVKTSIDQSVVFTAAIFLTVSSSSASSLPPHISRQNYVYDPNSIPQNEKILNLFVRLAAHTANQLVRLKMKSEDGVDEEGSLLAEKVEDDSRSTDSSEKSAVQVPHLRIMDQKDKTEPSRTPGSRSEEQTEDQRVFINESNRSADNLGRKTFQQLSDDVTRSGIESLEGRKLLRNSAPSSAVGFRSLFPDEEIKKERNFPSSELSVDEPATVVYDVPPDPEDVEQDGPVELENRAFFNFERNNYITHYTGQSTNAHAADTTVNKFGSEHSGNVVINEDPGSKLTGHNHFGIFGQGSIGSGVVGNQIAAGVSGSFGITNVVPSVTANSAASASLGITNVAHSVIGNSASSATSGIANVGQSVVDNSASAASSAIMNFDQTMNGNSAYSAPSGSLNVDQSITGNSNSLTASKTMNVDQSITGNSAAAASSAITNFDQSRIKNSASSATSGSSNVGQSMIGNSASAASSAVMNFDKSMTGNSASADSSASSGISNVDQSITGSSNSLTASQIWNADQSMTGNSAASASLGITNVDQSVIGNSASSANTHFDQSGIQNSASSATSGISNADQSVIGNSASALSLDSSGISSGISNVDQTMVGNSNTLTASQISNVDQSMNRNSASSASSNFKKSFEVNMSHDKSETTGSSAAASSKNYKLLSGKIAASDSEEIFSQAVGNVGLDVTKKIQSLDQSSATEFHGEQNSGHKKWPGHFQGLGMPSKQSPELNVQGSGNLESSVERFLDETVANNEQGTMIHGQSNAQVIHSQESSQRQELKAEEKRHQKSDNFNIGSGRHDSLIAAQHAGLGVEANYQGQIHQATGFENSEQLSSSSLSNNSRQEITKQANGSGYSLEGQMSVGLGHGAQDFSSEKKELSDSRQGLSAISAEANIQAGGSLKGFSAGLGVLSDKINIAKDSIDSKTTFGGGLNLSGHLLTG